MRSLPWFALLAACHTAAVTPHAADPAKGPVEGAVCDLRDRIIVASDVHETAKPTVGDSESSAPIAGWVIVIPRADPTHPTRVPIDPASADVDECGGQGGGHAGCTDESGLHIKSSAFDGELTLFPGYNFSVGDGSCRGNGAIGLTAVCATAKHLAIQTDKEIALYDATSEDPIQGHAAIQGSSLVVDGQTEPCLAIQTKRIPH